MISKLKYSIGILFVVSNICNAGTSDVSLTYHWHLHQPVYWPEKASNLNRYQYAKDSIDLKLSNTGNFYSGSTYKHPRNNLVNGDGGEYDSVFDKADRVQAYQYGGKNSIATLSSHSDAGASISYSGSLQENINSLGKASAYGYGPDWNEGYKTAHSWTTTGGFPKADMLGMTYHHAFSPLLPESVLRKEIEIFKEIWWKSWNGNPDKSDHSKGFWPVEVAFSEAMIPVLIDEGYEWVIIANSHLARTCTNYMDVANRGTGGWNIDPPNRADVLGPTVPAAQWFSGSRDARGGTFPVPYAYQAHKAKYVNPETGAESKITIVPMCDYLSYENGYGSMGTGVIDAEIAPYADSSHPCLVLMAHDGDNAWGGGSSYYQESVPNLMNEAASKGYHPTTIQQFLNDHPVPDNDVVHVEDGAWVNAASDWGHPQFINWLWPPARDPSDPEYDYNDSRTWMNITNGWSEDWRNWAVLIAGANWCETAEQIAEDNGRAVNAWKIQEPYQQDGTYNNPNNVEQAWHFYLGGLDSGFMYYGNSLDDEVKQTLACNRAIGLAQQAINNNPGNITDQTPPTIFKPQRYPWNPGGKGWGPLTGYQPIGFDGNPPFSSDFYIWTLVYDYSGVSNVTLYVRNDNDGVNPLSSNQNEVYAQGSEVGAWQAIPMHPRNPPLTPTEGDNGNTIDYFITPDYMATHYRAKVTGRRNKLVDYYIAATDNNGNIRKSEIQHVYVEDDGNSSARVVFSDDPRDCAPLVVTYNPAGGPLAGISPIYQQISFDNAVTWSNVLMTAVGDGSYVCTNVVPDNAPSAIVNFNNGSGVSDDNNGGNWSTNIRDCDAPYGPAVVTFDPAAPTGCVDVTITYRPNAGVLLGSDAIYIHVGHDGWQDVVSPDGLMSNRNDGSWQYVYSIPIGASSVECAFNNGNMTWDNNNGSNWIINISSCSPRPVILTPGSPIITDDPVGQNDPDDAFDFVMSSYASSTLQGGFGDFGRVYVNYDDTNLYIGGINCDMAGTNNGMILFMGINTLSDNVSNLWNLAGLPNGLDILHNITFDKPVDLAIVIGDEWGDGTYTNFMLENGYDFGQGIYYLSSSSGKFVPVPGSKLSQFDGVGTNRTGVADYDGNRQTDRWESSIPWVDLGADGINSISNIYICGVIASDGISGNDRFISGNYLGAGISGTLVGGNYGFNLVAINPMDIQLPSFDSDNDTLPDNWELQYFVNLGFLSEGNDWDNDGAIDGDERYAGTDPGDAESVLRIDNITVGNSGTNAVITWRSVKGKYYSLYTATNLLSGFMLQNSGIPATVPDNIYTAQVPESGIWFYQVRPEK